jgi:ATP-dependent DNA ligase
VSFPEGTVLDGEVQARSFKETIHTCKRGQKAPNSEWVVFVVFDITFHAGKDLMGLSYADRRKVLEGLFSKEDITDKIFPQKYSDKRLFLAKDFENTLEVYNKIREAGFEGIVLREESAIYGTGVLKHKPQPTVDAVVIGFKGGENGYDAYDGKPMSKDEIEAKLSLSRKGEDVEMKGLISLSQDCPDGMVGALVTAQWKEDSEESEPKDEVLAERIIEGKFMKLKYVAGASGFSLADRKRYTEKMWAKRKELVWNNRMKTWYLPESEWFCVEMQVQELSDKGHWRFPQILRDREDKLIEDCIYSHQKLICESEN